MNKKQEDTKIRFRDIPHILNRQANALEHQANIIERQNDVLELSLISSALMTCVTLEQYNKSRGLDALDCSELNKKYCDLVKKNQTNS